MIYLGLGANLISRRAADPAASLELACRRLEELGLEIAQRSPWFEAEPVPASGQPWFVNGVVGVSSGLTASQLLGEIKRLEAWFGRSSNARWAAREMDIDILDFDGRVLPDAATWLESPGAGRDQLVLPHPRLHQRRFVLAPLAAMTPDWRHPVFLKTARQLLEGLSDDGGIVRPLA